MKGSSVLQNISKGIFQPSKGVYHSLLFADGQGQTISPSAEQRHFSLQSSRGAGYSRQAIKYDYNKSKEKQVKQTVSNMESELASSLPHLHVFKIARQNSSISYPTADFRYAVITIHAY